MQFNCVARILCDMQDILLEIDTTNRHKWMAEWTTKNCNKNEIDVINNN